MVLDVHKKVVHMNALIKKLNFLHGEGSRRHKLSNPVSPAIKTDKNFIGCRQVENNTLRKTMELFSCKYWVLVVEPFFYNNRATNIFLCLMFKTKKDEITRALHFLSSRFLLFGCCLQLLMHIRIVVCFIFRPIFVHPFPKRSVT